MKAFELRRADSGDVKALLDIYNYYVLNTAFTFDIEPPTFAQRKDWFDLFAPAGRYQCFVAAKEGAVIGWACSARFNDRAAYDTSVMTSAYLAPGEGGQGLGTRLYEGLFGALAGEDLHRAYALITVPNEPSEALHKKFGFARMGIARGVGRKFGRYWDVAWYEKAL